MLRLLVYFWLTLKYSDGAWLNLSARAFIHCQKGLKPRHNSCIHNPLYHTLTLVWDVQMFIPTRNPLFTLATLPSLFQPQITAS